ncbi:hypothetical protein GE061_000028 [Apolygus lucorum]|uniref:Uncharacterized protein n=1 Tax=Apolygus lucorum TaxID=248454 RepID=A0A8S9Y394_APOLU|nr:hypothetical protein GE061_000028 [Apolygus lucorum]
MITSSQVKPQLDIEKKMEFRGERGGVQWPLLVPWVEEGLVCRGGGVVPRGGGVVPRGGGVVPRGGGVVPRGGGIVPRGGVVILRGSILIVGGGGSDPMVRDSAQSREGGPLDWALLSPADVRRAITLRNLVVSSLRRDVLDVPREPITMGWIVTSIPS